MTADTIIRVTRGQWTESTHTGHIAIVDTSGRLIGRIGDPERVTFVRSCAKPLQALPVVVSGAARAYELSPQELALMCASHSGEEHHVHTASSILHKIGLDPSFLQCGTHKPYDLATAERLASRGEQPTPLHHNCSGKHSGMLTLSMHLGVDPAGYFHPEHPVQRQMRSSVSAMCGVPEDELLLATDGCGVPVFGMPLSRLAYGYARFGTGDGPPAEMSDACRTLRQAMLAHPEYVAGSDRFDTALMNAVPGGLIAKMGAEGVFAVAWPERGLGLAVKVEDGSLRALYPAVAEALRQIGALADPMPEALRQWHHPEVPNAKGEAIGRIEPVFRLEDLRDPL